MYRWQVMGHERYVEMAKGLHFVDQRLPSSRGTIYSADGSVLAVDEPVWGAYASIGLDAEDRKAFEKDRQKFIDTVTDVLKLDPKDVNKKLDEDFIYVVLKHNVSAEDKQLLEKANLYGLHFEKEEKRLYPNGKLACHVLGFVGKNNKGKDIGMYGLEGYYAGDLLGQEGFQYEEKDSRGNVVMTGEYDPVLPRKGKNIVLTIRSGLQARVESLLEKNVKQYKAKSGTAIIMDPRTGEILVMANYPNYNPNYYWEVKDYSVYKNRAVSDVYEYGSVNKVLTVSEALQEKRITSNTICHDHEGKIKVIDKTIYTWDLKPDGDLTPKGILQMSNNVCAVKVGLSVGIQKTYDYLQKFGIGDFIGIGLQDEATSYLKPLEKWNEVDLASESFGQMISATPLQVISAVSTIANNGKRMKPYIVKELYDDKEKIEIHPEVISQPISAKVAYDVQDMMAGVVTGGDGSTFFKKNVPNYSIAGKTGTAQIPYPDKYGYDEDRTNTTFVGYSPIHGAKVIMLVRLEEPQTSTFAALTAVPTWVDIFKNVAMDLGIAPVRN